MKCKDCPFFQSSGFGMIGGVCRLSGEFMNKNSGCERSKGDDNND